MKIKDMALSAAYVGQRVVKAICVGAQEVWSAIKYIVFKDKVVEQICAENWGDGVGITEEQAAKVTNLGTVFRDNTEITSFDELAKFENVKSIPQGAFHQCYNLKSIKFPEGLESIGTQSFQGCGLENITFPKSLGSIRNYAFHTCSILTTLYVDTLSHLFSIQYESGTASPFTGVSDSKQTSIYVNGELLKGHIGIPSGTTLIPNRLFNHNTDITGISLPESLIKICNSAFTTCSNLASDVVIPNGVTAIDGNAFRACSKVTSFQLNESLTSIGDYAFASCGSKDLFTIPSTVTKIGNAAFFQTPVKTFICKAITPPTVSNIFLSCEVLYVPDQSVEAYREASGWSAFADRIKPLSEYREQ